MVARVVSRKRSFEHSTIDLTLADNDDMDIETVLEVSPCSFSPCGGSSRASRSRSLTPKLRSRSTSRAGSARARSKSSTKCVSRSPIRTRSVSSSPRAKKQKTAAISCVKSPNNAGGQPKEQNHADKVTSELANCMEMFCRAQAEHAIAAALPKLERFTFWQSNDKVIRKTSCRSTTLGARRSVVTSRSAVFGKFLDKHNNLSVSSSSDDDDDCDIELVIKSPRLEDVLPEVNLDGEDE